MTNITADVKGRRVVLTDLCFSPMKNNLCAVQTPLGWFQSNASQLSVSDNHKHTYLDHIAKCIDLPLEQGKDDPFNMSCAGRYGGPILPNVALADFKNDDYFAAKSVVITIMLNNHINNEDNIEALEWEKKFLDFMHNYSNPMMKVVYYSEVFSNYSLAKII